MDSILVQFFRSLAPFSEKELNEIALVSRQVSLQKNEFFSKAGRISDSIAFVKEGVLRSFYQVKGKETTTFFQSPGSIAVALKSFVQKKPALESIQAVTDAELFTISRDDLYHFYEENWKWQQVGRLVIEEYYMHIEQRMISLQSLSAQERYQLLSRDFPEVIRIVPLQHIASYLGISPETLSRIRKSA